MSKIEEKPWVHPKYADLYSFIELKIMRLGDVHSSSRRSSEARAALASLRHSIGQKPGAVPEIWAYTLEGLPDKYLGRDLEVSTVEKVVHATLGLYALHQQARDTSMHVSGVNFGRACSQLARVLSSEQAVRRRFQALLTAQGLAESLHHARGLVSQMRSANVPQDYALFATHLVQLQDPRWADNVRLTWGRDYYFKLPQSPKDSTDAADESQHIEEE